MIQIQLPVNATESAVALRGRPPLQHLSINWTCLRNIYILGPSQHLLCQKLRMWVRVIYFNKLAKCSDVHWSSRTMILRERMVRNFNWRIKLSLPRTHLSILILLKVGGPDVRFLSSRCTYDTFFLPSKIIKHASILFFILDPNYRK